MYVTVIHDIHDTDKFWSAADSSTLPERVTLHSVFPNEDGTRAVCLWEAESIAEVRGLVENTVGEWSKNEFYEVGKNAAGLPS